MSTIYCYCRVICEMELSNHFKPVMFDFYGNFSPGHRIKLNCVWCVCGVSRVSVCFLFFLISMRGTINNHVDIISLTKLLGYNECRGEGDIVNFQYKR